MTPTRSLARWLFVVALIAGCAGEPPPMSPPAEEPNPKLAELQEYLALVAGVDARDCGVHLFSYVDGRLVKASQSDLLASRDCAARAFESKAGSWTYATYPGVEATGATGLVGAPDGLMYRFDYDGAPGGDPSEPGRFSLTRCVPPVTITDGPWHRYMCAGPED